MARLQGEQMLALQGSWKAATVTLHPTQTTLGTPVTLPTSEPGTSQVSYTVAGGHLPTWDNPLYSQSYCPVVIAAGYAASAITLSYRLLKNSTSTNTGTKSVSAGNYWTLTACYYGTANVCSLGDTLELRFWSSGTDTDWRYYALVILPTRLFPARPRRTLIPVAVHTSATYGISGSGGGSNDLQFYVQSDNPPWPIRFGFYSTSSALTTFDVWVPHFTYGLNRLQPDEWPEVYFYQTTNASYVPYYRALHYINQVRWREGPDL